MSKTVNDFIGYQEGDVITLSDIQTQQEYNESEVDFIITSTRIYQEPEKAFTYTGYIASYKEGTSDEKQIMLLIRQIGDNFDLRVFFLDSDGPSEDFEALFNDSEEEDLLERIEATLYFDDGDLSVTWDRQGQTNFGIEAIYSDSEETMLKSIAEYFTNDETHGNPHCFIEWTGDREGGYVEIWYGCDIREDDVEIFQRKE
jgi:hypothetical protein